MVSKAHKKKKEEVDGLENVEDLVAEVFEDAKEEKKEEVLDYKSLVHEILKEIECGSRDRQGEWDHWVLKIKEKLKKIAGE